MWVGATSVFYPERPTPQTVFEMLRGYQPTMFFAVPTLYAAMLADPECKPENMSSRLRLCFSAGEPLPAHIGEDGSNDSASTSSTASARPRWGIFF